MAAQLAVPQEVLSFIVIIIIFLFCSVIQVGDEPGKLLITLFVRES
jgi:hypothetical protein